MRTEEQKQMKRERDKRYRERNKEKVLKRQREIGAAYRKTDAYQEWRGKARDRIVRWKATKRRELGCKPRLHDHHVRAFVQYKKRKDKEEFKQNLHDSHVRAKWALSDADYRRWKYKNDPAFNARERIRNQIKKMSQKHPRLGCIIRGAINRNGESKTIHDLLGYSVRELKAHLEKQFTKGMTWDEFLKGNIHIDHIIPKSVFDLTEEEDISRCWAMSNLRPLWAKDNLRKGAKVEYVI